MNPNREEPFSKDWDKDLALSLILNFNQYRVLKGKEHLMDCMANLYPFDQEDTNYM